MAMHGFQGELSALNLDSRVAGGRGPLLRRVSRPCWGRSAGGTRLKAFLALASLRPLVCQRACSLRRVSLALASPWQAPARRRDRRASPPSLGQADRCRRRSAFYLYLYLVVVVSTYIDIQVYISIYASKHMCVVQQSCFFLRPVLAPFQYEPQLAQTMAEILPAAHVGVARPDVELGGVPESADRGS